MHYSCFDSYYASVLSRSESQMEMMLDTDRGQFDCPLCKRLSNLLVPTTRVCPCPDASSSSRGTDMTVVSGETGSRRVNESWSSESGRAGDEEPRKRKTVGVSLNHQEADKAPKKTQRPESSRDERGAWSEVGSTSNSSDWFTADDGPVTVSDSPMLVVDDKSARGTRAPRVAGSSSSGSGGESLPSWMAWMDQPALVRRVAVDVKG